MAQEEAQKSADVVVVSTEKPMTDDKEVTVPAPVPEKEVTPPVASEEKAVPEKVAVETEAEKAAPVKEEETVVAEKVIAPSPEELEKKALEEFKELVREALNKREFTAPATPPVKEEKAEEKKPAEETKEEEKEKKEEEKATVPAQEEAVKSGEKPSEPAAAPAETKPEEKEVVPVTTEKASGAEEDGTKTVEAIEESIVSVTPQESTAAPEETTVVAEAEPVEPEEVSIYGVPLLQDERSDVILLKFLRARDFKVKEALTMLKNTVQWRKENKIDELVEAEAGEEASEFEKMVFAHGVDKEGHVVIYSSYGEFQNKELFSDKEKLNKFLNWRIQLQEKCVRALDFSSPDAKSSFVFVSDFRNAPGLGKRALWQFIRRAVKQFEDNYPEFATRELFINVPWWYIPYYKTFGSIITSPRTRSKMVLAGPSKSTDTIFKYISPEQVPVKYGGLSKDIPSTNGDTVTEAIVKPAAKYTIELPASE
ncbi:BnaC06g43790D, partial [Brassica napus]